LLKATADATANGYTAVTAAEYLEAAKKEANAAELYTLSNGNYSVASASSVLTTLYNISSTCVTYDQLVTDGFAETIKTKNLYAEGSATKATSYVKGTTYYDVAYAADENLQASATPITTASLAQAGATGDHAYNKLYTSDASNDYTVLSGNTSITESTQNYWVIDKADEITSVKAESFGVGIYSDADDDDKRTAVSTVEGSKVADGNSYYKIDSTKVSEPDYSLASVKKLLIESINSSAFDSENLDVDCLADLIDISLVSTPKSSIKTVTNDLKGAYTYKISARSTSLGTSADNDETPAGPHTGLEIGKSNTLVTGSTTFTVYNADYKGTVAWNQSSAVNATQGDDSSYKVNLSPEDGTEIEYVDLSKIEVKYDDDSKTIKNAKLTITVTDADGKTVDADQLKEPGTYYVSVSYNDEDTSGKVVCAS
jgi:hypothetical protein